MKNKKQKNYNPLFDPATDNAPIDPTVQKKVINDPKVDPSGMDEKDLEFLNMVMDKVDKGEINLIDANSILNNKVYDKLSDEAKGKADFDGMNILAILRQIKSLWDLDKRKSFQIKNLVHQVRLTKERVEAKCGDVFII